MGLTTIEIEVRNHAKPEVTEKLLQEESP